MVMRWLRPITAFGAGQRVLNALGSPSAGSVSTVVVPFGVVIKDMNNSGPTAGESLPDTTATDSAGFVTYSKP